MKQIISETSFIQVKYLMIRTKIVKASVEWWETESYEYKL
jgi:hypothetical protein